MNILTTIKQFGFSTELPEIITVATAQPSSPVTVKLFMNNNLEWTTELYANESRVFLYDIRQIIELIIKLEEEVSEVCSLTFIEGQTEVDTGEFTVVLSDRIMPADANFWLKRHFISNRDVQVISRTGLQTLQWAVYPAETMAYKIVAIVENENGIQQELEWVYKASSSVPNGIYTKNIDVQDIQDHFESNGILREFTVVHGLRSMKFFVVDEEPQLQLLINNNFNCQERVHLYGVTIEKNKLEAVEAQYLRKKIKYDFELNQEFEFESALISKEEGDFLREIFTAQKVLIVDGGNQREILIDGESEISDSMTAENRIKFTYKFADT